MNRGLFNIHAAYLKRGFSKIKNKKGGFKGSCKRRRMLLECTKSAKLLLFVYSRREIIVTQDERNDFVTDKGHSYLLSGEF